MGSSREKIVTFLLGALLSTVLVSVGVWLGRRGENAPYARVDKALVPIGRAYAGDVVSAYSAAWKQAASDVEAGEPVAKTIAAVKTAWDAARLRAYQAEVSPAFSAIVPDGATEASITPSQRAALGAAFRGFAMGLSP